MQQYHPDQVDIARPLNTHPLLTWSDGGIGGVTSGRCRPYRLIWWGFGLEGVGPRDARIAALDAAIKWLASDPQPYGLVLEAPTTLRIGPSPSTQSITLTLHNTGIQTDTFRLSLSPARWPFTLTLPDGRTAITQADLTLPGCISGVLTVTMRIPPAVPRHQAAQSVLRVQSLNDPRLSQHLTLTVKTPAPLLFVDDHRWYATGAAITQALQRSGAAFDVLTTDGNRLPPETALSRYPLVLWSTAYDWFSPLSEDDEAALRAYLEGGGRLLLASQDYLDVRPDSDFARAFLGVADAHLSITATNALPADANPLGLPPAYWKLQYPFPNWSDHLVPTPQAQRLLLSATGGRLYTLGLARPGAGWRTVFLAFAPESLPPAARTDLLARALLWLGPFGDTQLHLPDSIPAGASFPISLTVRPAVSQPLPARLEVTFPPTVTLGSGPLQGGWHGDVAAHRLVWEGTLQPRQVMHFQASLNAPPVTAGAPLTFQARFFTTQTLTQTLTFTAYVETPWPRFRVNLSNARLSWPGQEVTVTIPITNAGNRTGTFYLQLNLPLDMAILLDSVHFSTGRVMISARLLIWDGTLPAQSSGQITLRARLERLPARASAPLVLLARMNTPAGERASWAVIQTPLRVFLPWVGR